ncbi:MAG: helicase C-terminal domain-containing protein [Candidatus Dormibacteria bacterium]
MPSGSSFVAFDLETTGISPKRDRIIEIGAVRFDAENRITGELDLVVNPGIPVPLVIQRLVGLTDADLSEAPTPVEAVAQLADFSAGAHLVAHGGAFDIAFCSLVLPEEFRHRPLMDTLELARILLPTAPSHSLPLLSRALGLGHERPHRALSDADATRQLLLHLVAAAAHLPGPVLASMREVAARAGSPLRTFLADVVAGDGAATGPPRVAAGPRRVSLGMIGTDTDRLDVAAAAFFAPDGPLARRRPGYEYRDAQQQMARAVAQTLARSGRLLVEAGTGVGKSLAYLVPLALWASGGGGRAVVATNTITLQEQLVEVDLPSLQAPAGEPEGPTVAYAMLKGRRHYLSLRRWERFLGGGVTGSGNVVDLDTVRFTLKLLVWLAETHTGDRAELRLTTEEELLWRRVESDPGDCLGRACSNWGTARCFMVAARRAADAASLVITNHALLLSDAEAQGRIIAPFESLVVDEAHHLEASATSQLGVRLRALDITIVLDRLPPASEPELTAALEACREAAHRLFGEAKGFAGQSLGGEHPGNGVVGLSPEIRQGPHFTAVLRAAHHAVAALRTCARALAEARGRAPVQVELLPQPERLDDELAAAAAALEELALSIDRVLCAPSPDNVVWVELRAEQAELRSAPVSVTEALQESVFGRVDAAVLTSATLTVADSFEFVRERVGIGAGAEELALASPFDYYAQSVCIVPADIPPYDDAGYEPALAALLGDLATRLGGRTLALFTGYGPLQRVHRLVAGRLDGEGIAVIGQGMDGTRRQILRSFMDHPRTLLLGTSSLWEGVDLPGDMLHCVVIAKLPFAVPTDPLVRARSERLRDPFSEYVLPMAVLRLKQGFGRLIRSEGDRGAVVLCDSRLTTRDYGARFFETLPPAEVRRCGLAEAGRIAADFVGIGAGSS